MHKHAPAIAFLGEFSQLLSPQYQIGSWSSLMVKPLKIMGSMQSSPKSFSSALSFFSAIFWQSVEEHSQITSTNVYGSTVKDLEDQSLAADLCSDLAQTAQWEKNWHVTFNTFKTKFVMLHHHKARTEFSLVMLNGCRLCLEYLLGQAHSNPEELMHTICH